MQKKKQLVGFKWEKGAANIINVEIKVGTDTKGVGSSELPEVSSL